MINNFFQTLINRKTVNQDFLDQFEHYSIDNSYEISLTLSLDCYYDGVPRNIHKTWLLSFYSLSKSIKIQLLRRIFIETFSILNLEYSHFIENNLIPIIIDYEICTPNTLLFYIDYLYKLRIKKHAFNTHTSIFTIFAWIELILFLHIHLINFISHNSHSHPHRQFKVFIACILLIISIIHLTLAITTFNKRRMFCNYIQCLYKSKKMYKYTSYLLEGFNICDISQLQSINKQRKNGIRLNLPNQITMNDITVLSLKYLFVIVHCLCIINFYCGITAIFLFPIIYAVMIHIDDIYKTIYKDEHQLLLTALQKVTKNKLLLPKQRNKYVRYDHVISKLIAPKIKNKNKKINIGRSQKLKSKFNSVIIQYAFIFLAMSTFGWTFFLLTPFVLGFAIIFELDLGTRLQTETVLNDFPYFWIYIFVSIKFVIGLSLMMFFNFYFSHKYNACDAWISTLIGQPNASNNNDENDGSLKYDAYKSLWFFLIIIISILVIMVLIIDINAVIVSIFKLISWIALYMWLLSYSVTQITPEYQRAMDWKSVVKPWNWLNTNLLHTKLG